MSDFARLMEMALAQGALPGPLFGQEPEAAPTPAEMPKSYGAGTRDAPEEHSTRNTSGRR